MPRLLMDTWEANMVPKNRSIWFTKVLLMVSGFKLKLRGYWSRNTFNNNNTVGDKHINELDELIKISLKIKRNSNTKLYNNQKILSHCRWSQVSTTWIKWHYYDISNTKIPSKAFWSRLPELFSSKGFHHFSTSIYQAIVHPLNHSY